MPTLSLGLRPFLVASAIVLVVMGACDALWLGAVAKDFYRREMGGLMADPVRVVPAAVFYVGYSLALVFLALGGAPATLAEAIARSAVVGLLAYGTYDLTGLAVIRGFSTPLALVDLVYGTVASAIAGGVAWRFALPR